MYLNMCVFKDLAYSFNKTQIFISTIHPFLNIYIYVSILIDFLSKFFFLFLRKPNYKMGA